MSHPQEKTRRPGRFSVMMATEGTYPFQRGGVSTWCDVLLQSLPDIDFTIMAVMMNPFMRQQYDLPPNVLEVIRAPLWGVEEPMEYTTSVPFSVVYEAKRATTDDVIRTQFAPLFRSFMREVMRDGDPTLIGMILYGLHRYFQGHDYNQTFRSRVAWDVFRAELVRNANQETARFQEAAGRDLLPGEEMPLNCTLPSILDATDCLRWLYRFLSILSHAVPQADITHATASAFCAIPCIIAKQAYGAPFLLTEHGVYLREQYLSIGRSKYSYHCKRFLLQLIRSVVRCSYRYADVVSPVCHWNTRWEKRLGVPEERIRVIYNGVDPNRFCPLSGVERDPRPTVITMALIFPLKDIATLLHAADIVRRQIPDVQFKLFGPAADEFYYQSCLRLRERLKLQSTFHFMGRTANPEHAYNEGDISALSSLSEAFPFSVVEAMMCGKAVVATDVGGVREAIGDAGLVVRARNPEQFAQGIVTLLRDPEMRAQMGEDARNRALTHFTIDGCVSQYRDAYDTLIREKMPSTHEQAA